MTAPIRPPTALPRARTSTADGLGISALYIGPGKAGKTTCAMSWPDPFVIYLDHNTAGLQATQPTPPYLLVDDLKPEPVAALTQQILPAIANGRISELTDRPVRTIVIDPLTVLLGELLARKIAGNNPMKGFDQFGAFLYQAENIVSGQITPLVRRGFNVVCTIHVGEYGGGDEPTTRRPAVPGAFRNILCSRFDAVLLCGSELVPEVVAGKPTGKRIPEHYVYTINPDRSYEGIGDGLGRQGGRFKQLPPKMDGRYLALAKAWGLGE